MKDFCLELAAQQTGYNVKLNTIREYLQANILRVLQDQGFFRTTAFVGGTALRFLHGLPRFSEDLDFSLISDRNYDFADLCKTIKEELLRCGYTVEITVNDKKTVLSASFKFTDLLYEARISPLKSQKFSVKLKIDTNPPAGGVTQTLLVRKFFSLSFLTFDLPSLFAGKYNAILSRKFDKGRDYFDLGWYLTRDKDLTPNFELLKNGLNQTGYPGTIPHESNWRAVLAEHLESVNWDKVTEDLKKFLENPDDLAMANPETLSRLLR
jgi:predicted nucleotidyltransferase component of viral defense system